MSGELESKLFEFCDLLGWLSYEGYDVSEIGAEGFAVTANHSRPDTGDTYHVFPGHVTKSIPRPKEWH